MKVDLLVRGLCCLRPGIPGVSENILVSNVIGRFLEHSRLYYFHNGGEDEMYMGSADLMPRNLDRRVELLFPILDPHVKAGLRDVVLQKYLADNRRARTILADGTSDFKPVRSSRAVDSQAWLLKNRTKLGR